MPSITIELTYIQKYNLLYIRKNEVTGNAN